MADTEALAELLAERDRLRRVTELQAATIEQQADSIQKIMEQSERRKEFADRLRAQVEDMRTAVHSCHPGCSNARCVAERLRAEIADALHAMRAYARDNPRHEYQGATQDPDGVHAWLARNDRA